MIDFIDILLPALCAGLLVLSTHIPLGHQVIKRGIIFIDLAIAQIAGLGAVIASTTDLTHHVWGASYLVPALFALLGALVIASFERYAKRHLEALIGCLYVLSATAAYLILANDPHGDELLKQVLSGQILWVTFSDLYFHLALYSVIIVTLIAKPNLLSGRWFYFIFAIAITSSVQLVGVFLVFSTLIMPSIACSYAKKHRLITAYIIGILSFVAGLTMSTLFDLPSGATVVWCMAIVSISYVFGYKSLSKAR